MNVMRLASILPQFEVLQTKLICALRKIANASAQ